MNSLFLPATVWRFECEYGVSWWAQKPPAHVTRTYNSNLEMELARCHIPEGVTLLSAPDISLPSRFSVMYVKRVPVDSRW